MFQFRKWICWMYGCMYVCIFEVLGRDNISGHWRPLWMSMDYNDGQMIFWDLGGLKLPDICLTDEKKPRKNLTQETCPDRGSNPGPLRDRRACYHLVHKYVENSSTLAVSVPINLGIKLGFVSVKDPQKLTLWNPCPELRGLSDLVTILAMELVSLYQFIDCICNVEVIPHISFKVAVE